MLFARKLVSSAWKCQTWLIPMVCLIVAIYPETTEGKYDVGNLWYTDAFACEQLNYINCEATCNINGKVHTIQWINSGDCLIDERDDYLRFQFDKSLELNISTSDCLAIVKVNHEELKIRYVEIPSFGDDCIKVMHDVPYETISFWLECFVNQSKLYDVTGQYFHLRDGRVILANGSTIDYKCGPSNIKQSSTCTEGQDYAKMVPPVPDNCSQPIIEPAPASSSAPSHCIIISVAIILFHVARFVMQIMDTLLADNIQGGQTELAIYDL